MKLRAVDLFCGGGGLSKGLADAGFDVVAAFDNWPIAIDFYRDNISDHPVLHADISKHSEIVPCIESFKPDLIAGGPPCQDFSSAGNRSEGERANLTVSYARLIAEIQPKYFIMENVERARRSKAFSDAIRVFKTVGYGMTEAVLNAALCGVPQVRKRIFVFGELGGKDNALSSVYYEKQADHLMTVRDYFGDRLGIDHYYRHPRSYARRAVFSIDEPSPTVRGVNRPVPKGYPGHLGDSAPITPDLRNLTTKERSMIQTFPEDWVLNGTKTGLEQVIGNAVPCNLAKFVGESILQYLDNRTFYDECLSDRDQLIMFEQRAKYRTKLESTISAT